MPVGQKYWSRAKQIIPENFIIFKKSRFIFTIGQLTLKKVKI